MTYTAYMSHVERALGILARIPRGRGACLALCFGVVILAEMPGSTMTSGDRVRFHWDWATDAMQSRAGANAVTQPRQRVPLVRDFSHRQVFFPEVVPAKNIEKVRNDPRFWNQYLERHAHRYVPSRWDYVPDPNANDTVARDWAFSLNLGNGGTISMPAKYSFDVNAPASCTNDFVITGVNVAGSTTQANLVGVNSLYNTPAGDGLCPGTRNPARRQGAQRGSVGRGPLADRRL